jgi:hypothetical protein
MKNVVVFIYKSETIIISEKTESEENDLVQVVWIKSSPTLPPSSASSAKQRDVEMPDMVPESRNLMVKLRHKTKSLLR